MPVLLPLMLMQANFDPSGINSPYSSALPREIVDKKNEEDRKRRAEQAADAAAAAGPAVPESNEGCMLAVESDPAHSAEVARQAMNEAQGRTRVRAGLCLGAALAALDRWDEARTAFIQARDAADLEDHVSRARLGAMAGNAALGGGKPGEALSILAPAVADAKAAEDNALLASISLDRARALVALNQLDEAGTALADARNAAPGDPQVWLLSATLSRRQNKLAEAQTQIEKAAELAPQDPEVGLEAGVIAVLAGRDEAARRSWNSVVATSPNSPQAATAKGYLAQLGPEAKGHP
ncbi:tetratricopeptide repeat protein [Novosphingobium sp. PhB165]|uniref:tetratricopeptide repeat protein n=1 Tax=Novosphingobium sp. PhB165 TaxID=2485105 RepID=UPI00104B31D2|nr:tetratricopeptide repeat protein [Novosphingobium sp. PhB165]TCM18653.1 tetratricopeptide repeat protein [Novosphingobium sp. PhB165]